MSSFVIRIIPDDDPDFSWLDVESYRENPVYEYEGGPEIPAEEYADVNNHAAQIIFVYRREECRQCEGTGKRDERVYVTGDGERHIEYISCSACEGSGTILQVVDSLGGVDYYPRGTEPDGQWEVDSADDLPREWDDYTRATVRDMLGVSSDV